MARLFARPTKLSCQRCDVRGSCTSNCHMHFLLAQKAQNKSLNIVTLLILDKSTNACHISRSRTTYPAYKKEICVNPCLSGPICPASLSVKNKDFQAALLVCLTLVSPWYFVSLLQLLKDLKAET